MRLPGYQINWSSTILRLALGVIFLAHGCQKLFGLFGGGGLQSAIQTAAHIGFKPAPLWGVLLAGGEFFGGLFLILGFLTRFWAAVMGIIMLVAIGAVHGKNGFFSQNGGCEYNIALLGMAIALIISGAGNLAVDSRWRKKRVIS